MSFLIIVFRTSTMPEGRIIAMEVRTTDAGCSTPDEENTKPVYQFACRHRLKRFLASGVKHHASGVSRHRSGDAPNQKGKKAAGDVGFGDLHIEIIAADFFQGFHAGQGEDGRAQPKLYPPE